MGNVNVGSRSRPCVVVGRTGSFADFHIVHLFERTALRAICVRPEDDALTLVATKGEFGARHHGLFLC